MSALLDNTEAGWCKTLPPINLAFMRLECLKLAASRHPNYPAEIVVEVAQRFERFILGAAPASPAASEGSAGDE